jgi:Peptidase M50B-like
MVLARVGAVRIRDCDLTSDATMGWVREFALIRLEGPLNNWRMPKWSKTVSAVLLLPFCAGGAWALGLVITRSGGADTTWVPMFAGALCWLVIYALLPKPIWIYVFGHELTHAVWAWAFGARVKRFRATSDGGHVVVSRSNFLIALAPYFFPFYAVLLVSVFVVGHLIWNWGQYQAWFHLLLGAAYAFHVTLTCHILKTSQSDITQQGYFFSTIIIFLGNVGILLMAVPLLSGKVGVATALRWWFDCTGQVCRGLAHLF